MQFINYNFTLFFVNERKLLESFGNNKLLKVFI